MLKGLVAKFKTAFNRQTPTGNQNEQARGRFSLTLRQNNAAVPTNHQIDGTV